MSESRFPDRFLRIDSYAAHLLLLGRRNEHTDRLASELAAAGYHIARNLPEMDVSTGKLNDALDKQRLRVDAMIIAESSVDEACAISHRAQHVLRRTDVPVIFLLPSLDSSIRSRLMSSGGVCALCMPVNTTAVIEWIERALWMPHLYTRATLQNPAESPGKQLDWVRLDDA